MYITANKRAYMGAAMFVVCSTGCKQCASDDRVCCRVPYRSCP